MRNAKAVLTLAAFVAAATMIARAQTSVFVPGNASGGFGNPIDIVVPLVPAITVSGPSRITVTYVSGTVTPVAGVDAGPNGTKWNFNEAQSPLQEARGQSGGIDWLGALIGVFVPASRVGDWKFQPVDGAKALARNGIVPSTLVFVGTGKTFYVREAGTLYLGINDDLVGDNGGGFTVTVSVQ
jgi:hypothetical protein